MEIAVSQPALHTDPDQVLIRRMAAGDEEALRALYAAYGRRLFAYAFRLTGSRAAAEEAIQDALLAAWKGAAAYRGDSRAVTWLLGIVHHRALNLLRRKMPPSDALEEVVGRADAGAGLTELAEASERRKALTAALGQLSAEHRAVLELVFYQGLRLAEVAEVLRCPVGTVKSRLSHAKARLREALASQGWQAEDML